MPVAAGRAAARSSCLDELNTLDLPQRLDGRLHGTNPPRTEMTISRRENARVRADDVTARGENAAQHRETACWRAENATSRREHATTRRETPRHRREIT